MKGIDSPEKTCKTYEHELNILAGDEQPHENVGCVVLQPFAKMGKGKCVSAVVSDTRTI